MNLTVSSAPHIRSGDTTRRTMLDVLIALIPALIAAVILFGLRALVLTVISAAVCVVVELLYCLVTRRKSTVGDLSAVVTGVLLAFSLPASCPYWVVAVGDAFAILVVKGFIGGLGQNVFNPALGGRALIMLFWPATITRYGTEAVDAFNFGARGHRLLVHAAADHGPPGSARGQPARHVPRQDRRLHRRGLHPGAAHRPGLPAGAAASSAGASPWPT